MMKRVSFSLLLLLGCFGSFAQPGVVSGVYGVSGSLGGARFLGEAQGLAPGIEEVSRDEAPAGFEGAWRFGGVGFSELRRVARFSGADSLRSDSYRPTVGSLVLTGGLMAYGFAALKWQALQSFDHTVRQKVWFDNPHRPFAVDDYLQYAPALTVYVLNAAGVKGKHDLRDRTVIYIMANAFLGAAVLGLKHVISAERPDGSGDDGFPSGHTATAFAAAEFLRQEFRDRSVWYGVGGYTAAVGTSFFRLYNDKHWFSELTTGAGIGLLAAKAAYWAWPLVERKVFRHKPEKMVW